jgi:hypothetical protein
MAWPPTKFQLKDNVHSATASFTRIPYEMRDQISAIKLTEALARTNSKSNNNLRGVRRSIGYKLRCKGMLLKTEAFVYRIVHLTTHKREERHARRKTKPLTREIARNSQLAFPDFKSRRKGERRR